MDSPNDLTTTLPIIFEDDYFLVVNKPSGLPTQATVDKARANLYDLLLATKKWPYLALHHRLDAGTSGVILLVKNKEANKAASELFQKHLAQKTYHCLCHDLPEWNHLVHKNHLKAKKFSGGKTKMLSVTSGGDFAETDFVVLEKFAKNALIQAKPKTGRMHQIRTHLSELRVPILGDSLYFRADRKYPRLMLHAYELEFTHQFKKVAIKLRAEYDEDFVRILDKVRARAGESTNAGKSPSSD